jgi:hypothetical protein
VSRACAHPLQVSADVSAPGLPHLDLYPGDLPMQRQPEQLRFEVPQGDVHCRDRVAHRSGTPRIVHCFDHSVKRCADVKRVTSLRGISRDGVRRDLDRVDSRR